MMKIFEYTRSDYNDDYSQVLTIVDIHFFIQKHNFSNKK
jgi:hypothetical protein